LFTDDDPEGRQIQDQLVGILARKFAPFGITLIKPEIWSECWKQQVFSGGGVFKSTDGSVDEARYQQVWRTCAVSLAGQYGIDAVLDPAIIAVTAPLNQDIVRWHGVAEDMRSFGQRFWTGGSYSGKVTAASLLVTIHGVEGNLLFENAGGIEVVGQLTGTRTDPLRQKPGFLKSTNKLNRAVNIVFRPLMMPTGQ